MSDESEKAALITFAMVALLLLGIFICGFIMVTKANIESQKTLIIGNASYKCTKTNELKAE